jgi:hypothetical protein
MCDNYGVIAELHQYTSKLNHGASTQSCQWFSQVIWQGNINENTEEQEYNSYDYFLHSTTLLPSY